MAQSNTSNHQTQHNSYTINHKNNSVNRSRKGLKAWSQYISIIPDQLLTVSPRFPPQGFYTNREESMRTATLANLANGGYGQPCKTGQANPNIVLGPTVQQRSASPCFAALVMRNNTDTRIESLTRPEQRGQLLTAGYTIAVAVGDQYSELSGANYAAATFKMPNPFYFRL